MRVRQSWWYYFKKSFDIYKKGGDKFIGQETNGNKFYERVLDNKLKRYVLNEKDLDIPVHPLWLAWLNYKRKEPPSDVEIKQNLDHIRNVKQRADEIYERDLIKFPKYAEKVKKLEDKLLEEDKRNFPKRDDYF